MKCTILHESRGRMRVHVNAVRMTLHRADVLEAYLNHSEAIEHAKVYERTGDVLIKYKGSRAGAVTVLSHLSLITRNWIHWLLRLTAVRSTRNTRNVLSTCWCSVRSTSCFCLLRCRVIRTAFTCTRIRPRLSCKIVHFIVVFPYSAFPTANSGTAIKASSVQPLCPTT